MLRSLTVDILIYKETGQITNPKLQISNKLQITNSERVSRSDRNRTASVSAQRNQGALRRSGSIYSPRRARVVRRAKSEEIHSLSPAVIPSSGN